MIGSECSSKVSFRSASVPICTYRTEGTSSSKVAKDILLTSSSMMCSPTVRWQFSLSCQYGLWFSIAESLKSLETKTLMRLMGRLMKDFELTEEVRSFSQYSSSFVDTFLSFSPSGSLNIRHSSSLLFLR